MPRLLVNENFPAPATRVLRDRGVDVLSVQESMQGAHDGEILRCAVAQRRWLVTYDRDYGELVFARDDAAPPAIVGTLGRLAHSVSPGSPAGRGSKRHVGECGALMPIQFSVFLTRTGMKTILLPDQQLDPDEGRAGALRVR